MGRYGKRGRPPGLLMDKARRIERFEKEYGIGTYEKFVTLVKAGRSFKEIGAAFDFSGAAAHQRCHAPNFLGIAKPRARPVPSPQPRPYAGRERELRTLLRSGAVNEAVGRVFGVSPYVVSGWRRNLCIPSTYQTPSQLPAKKKRFKKLWAKGWAGAAIAKRLAISEGTVWSWRRKLRLRRRRKGGTRRT